jgi:hypothetical protein
LLQIAYTTPWIIMLSQLAYYSKIYGPQVWVQVSGFRVWDLRSVSVRKGFGQLASLSVAEDRHAVAVGVLQQNLRATGMM